MLLKKFRVSLNLFRNSIVCLYLITKFLFFLGGKRFRTIDFENKKKVKNHPLRRFILNNHSITKNQKDT